MIRVKNQLVGRHRLTNRGSTSSPNKLILKSVPGPKSSRSGSVAADERLKHPGIDVEREIDAHLRPVAAVMDAPSGVRDLRPANRLSGPAGLGHLRGRTLLEHPRTQQRIDRVRNVRKAGAQGVREVLDVPPRMAGDLPEDAHLEWIRLTAGTPGLECRRLFRGGHGGTDTTRKGPAPSDASSLRRRRPSEAPPTCGRELYRG